MSYRQRRAIVDRCVVSFAVCLERVTKSTALNGARSISRITLTTSYEQMSLLFSLRLIEGHAAGRLANPLNRSLGNAHECVYNNGKRCYRCLTAN